jgi:UDP-N-acetylglucosamine 1-carboxyvinyltransferase
MEQYVIKGGNPLYGEVEIGGAKNAALAILAAAIMTDETVTIDNLPNVRDINVLLQAIEEIGAYVERVDIHKVKINGSFIRGVNVDNEFIRRIRASYYLIGALLGKYKHAEVALPGGCDIGSRPIDLHMKGFRSMGADIDIAHGLVIARAKELKGTHIYMDKVSVGATINIMMAAAMADGKTVIENAAKEPHVVDVANFLNSMGANIRGAGTDVIRIVGVEKLHATEYSVIPDQIEAGTFMFAVAAAGGNVLVKNVIPKHLEATTAKLLEVGCQVEEFDDSVRVISDGHLKHTQVTTLPYPGFPTDMQPQMAVLLGIAEGTSTVTESIFENRFKYVDELTRMGADIKVESNIAIISGVKRDTGARVNAPDLRAGAALVIAGLAADGITVVDDIYYIQRGYEALEEKLTKIGAKIARVEDEKELQKFILKVS